MSVLAFWGHGGDGLIVDKVPRVEQFPSILELASRRPLNQGGVCRAMLPVGFSFSIAHKNIDSCNSWRGMPWDRLFAVELKPYILSSISGCTTLVVSVNTV